MDGEADAGGAGVPDFLRATPPREKFGARIMPDIVAEQDAESSMVFQSCQQPVILWTENPFLARGRAVLTPAPAHPGKPHACFEARLELYRHGRPHSSVDVAQSPEALLRLDVDVTSWRREQRGPITRTRDWPSSRGETGRPTYSRTVGTISTWLAITPIRRPAAIRPG